MISSNSLPNLTGAKDETSEPVSAFSVYNEMLRRKKKPKLNGPAGGVNKMKKKAKIANLKAEQMREIGMILQKLTENSAGGKDVSELDGTSTSHNEVANSDVISKLTMFNVKSKADNLALKKKKLNRKGNPTTSSKRMKVNNSVKFNNKSNSMSIDDSVIQNGESNPSNKVKKNEKTKATNKHVSTSQIKFKPKLTKTINMETNTETVYFNSDTDGCSSSLENEQEEENKHCQSLIKLRHRVTSPKQPSQGKTKCVQPKPQYKRKTFNNILKTIGLNSSGVGGENNTSIGLKSFEWIIKPVAEHEFAFTFWEKQPLLIQRRENQDFYSQLLSTPEIDEMLRENVVYFTKHLDMTSYSDGVRETHNLTGRANANVVWDFYSNGCSIRLLNPQAFFPQIHSLNASLQEYFGCFVGANVYLTPPNSQGFAPHYDDIEAFVLQIEGKKRWKLYAPRNDSEVLARFSSPNFSQDEIGKPCLDVVLEPGDMLYFPRGFIHQAFTVDGCHSLHITLSAYQKTAWVDLFEKALPLALESAVKADVMFRRGLPRDYLNCQRYGGDAVIAFKEKARQLMNRLVPHFISSLNTAVDKMGAQFMHDALPPVLSPEEEEKSVTKGGLTMVAGGVLKNMMYFQPTTEIKLLRANVCRLMKEEDETRLYHCVDNSLEYHAEDPQFLVLPPEGEKVVKSLARAYPSFTTINSLPHTDINDLLRLISDLWDAGLLMAQGLCSEEDLS